ncbi:MAG: hypothetical protein M3O82_05960 [Verrucomicrobiota bacterium]|nr:hypothetical protein [Verrucomicrobiota bacterium]
MEGIALSMPGNFQHGSDGALPSSQNPRHGADMRRARKHPVHQPMVERFNKPVIVFLTVCTQERKRVLATPD